jgi:hypothetical protein
MVSSHAAADHLASGEYKKLFLDSLNIIAGSMLVASQILKKFAIRLVLSGVFLIVGTLINIGILVYELASLIKSLTASNSQSLLENYWQQFQQDTPELTRKTVKAYGLKVLGYDRVDDRVYQIETDLLYESEKGIEVLTAYNKAPYDVYVGDLGKVGVESDGNVKETNLIGHWTDTDLTKDPVLTINDIHTQDLLFDGDSVWLGKLSWRAIIPLLQLGYQEQEIEGMVEFPTDWFDNLSFTGVSTS